MHEPIVLSDADLALGYLSGFCRDMESISRRNKHRHPLRFPLEGLCNHIGGALGEIAFARWIRLPLFFPSIVNYGRGGDVNGFQIRAVFPKFKEGEIRFRPRLMVRMAERSEDKFILILADPSDFLLRTWRATGWAFGHEVKELGDRERGDPPAKYLLPDRLRPVTEELRREVIATYDKKRVLEDSRKYCASLTAISRRLFCSQLGQAIATLGISKDDLQSALERCRKDHVDNGTSPDDLTWDWKNDEPRV